MKVEFKKEISEEDHTNIYARIDNYTEWHLVFVSIDNPLPDEDYWAVQDLFATGARICHKYTKIEEINLEIVN